MLASNADLQLTIYCLESKGDLATPYSVHFLHVVACQCCRALDYTPSRDSRDAYSRVAPKMVERRRIAPHAIGAIANGAGTS